MILQHFLSLQAWSAEEWAPFFPTRHGAGAVRLEKLVSGTTFTHDAFLIAIDQIAQSLK